MYLSRRSILQIVFDLAAGFERDPDFALHLALSWQNGSIADFSAFGEKAFILDTSERGFGALAVSRIFALKRQLRGYIAKHGIRSVLNLMPHVWSGNLVRIIQDAGARYFTIIHDAQPHPGDRTGLVHKLLMRDAYKAGGVFTLSRHVTDSLVSGVRIKPQRITTLFLPNTGSLRTNTPPVPAADQPWRLLFLGRLMACKGLPVFIDAIEKLALSGHSVSISVMGEGDITAVMLRLKNLGVNLVNRWLTAEEIAQAYRDHHAVVLSHLVD